MGTTFRITLYGDRAKAESAIREVWSRVDELDRTFSDYKADSEIMKLCRANDAAPGVPRPVSRDVVTVVRAALKRSAESDGAFDLTVGPLVQLWRSARRTQILPTEQERSAARAKVGYRKLTLDESAGTLAMAVPGMRLDFGGIVKGYAADEALAILTRHGFPQSLVAASGDIRAGDPLPGKPGWNVEIPALGKGLSPRRLTLANAAVSTSGDLFQHVEIQGVRYSHIVDPKTGLGLTGRRSVTVIAKAGIDADSLTKACSVLPPADAAKLIDRIDGAALFSITRETEDGPATTTRAGIIDRYLPAEPRKPNIVFILADDLGINDLGCYGRTEHHTPNLDQLARQGIRFTSAYCAQPICSPSRLAIMTGLHPARLHLTTYLPGRPDCPSQKLLHPIIVKQMALEQRTMAESLKEAGYATACIGKWHLGGAAFGPEKQGFDVVHAGRANTPPSATEGGKGEYDLTAKATDFIRAQANKPFFLYLPHNTPHIPLGAKPELIEKYRGTFHPTYAAMMHTMDDCVGRILKTLEELKLTENTIVVFTSDNGGLHVPELRDYPPTHNTPYRAGKGFLYEGGLRIPAIVRWPGTIPPGRVSDSPFVNSDWLPTLLEAAGLIPRDPLDGVSILPTLRGERSSRAPIFWHFPHYTNQGSRPAGAVRDGDWKLIEHYEDGRCELFNVISDPGETKDLSGAEPVRTTALKQKLAEWRKATKVQENRPNPNFDEAVYKKLYRDTDVSRLKPAATAEATAASIGTWRRDFDAVVPKKP